MRLVKENLYRLDDLINFLNRKGYQCDFNKMYVGNSFVSDEVYDMLYDTGSNIIFEFSGIAKITLFDPNEKNQQDSITSFSMPVSGLFIDQDCDVLFPKENFFKTFDVYQDLSLGFDDFIEKFNNPNSGGFPWIQNRDPYDLKVIYSLNVSDIPKSIKNVKFRVNNNFLAEKLSQKTAKANQKTEPNTENLNTEIIRLRELLNKKDEEINQFQQHQKHTKYIHDLNNLIKESEKDSKTKEQEEKIEQLIVINEQFSNEISFLKKRISVIASLKSTGIVDNQDQAVEETKENYSDLTPEQEIPNVRQRNNVLKIISILSEMADLPPEPFTAFNMMDAYAAQNSKEIPSKHTIADWLKRARDSN